MDKLLWADDERYHEGKPFPKRQGETRGGRPISS